MKWPLFAQEAVRQDEDVAQRESKPSDISPGKNRCIAISIVRGANASANGKKIRTSFILPATSHIPRKINAPANIATPAAPLRYRLTIQTVQANGTINSTNGIQYAGELKFVSS